MKKIKRSIAIILFMVTLVLPSICSNATEKGINTSYALRQLSGVPESSNVYSVKYYFYADKTKTIMTCTQNTTSGANVLAFSSTGIQGKLDTKGVSYSMPSDIGDLIITESLLSVPNSSNTYTGYGTVVG